MANKYALITGGSSGIGLATAHELAAKRYSLVLVSNQQELLRSTATEIISKYKVDCITLFVDLTDINAAKQIFDYCNKQQLCIEILVNNAGILVFSEVVATAAEKLNAILQLHINTPVMLCRLFGEQMKTRNSGYILNVSSISSVMPYPGISLYGPTKAFMRYFTRAPRHEMKIYNVRVTCLIPGTTATALYDPNRVNLKLATRVGIMKTAPFVEHKATSALLKNRAECIPGFINKLTVWFLPFVPSWVIYQLHRNTDILKKGNSALG